MVFDMSESVLGALWDANGGSCSAARHDETVVGKGSYRSLGRAPGHSEGLGKLLQGRDWFAKL